MPLSGDVGAAEATGADAAAVLVGTAALKIRATTVAVGVGAEVAGTSVVGGGAAVTTGVDTSGATVASSVGLASGLGTIIVGSTVTATVAGTGVSAAVRDTSNCPQKSAAVTSAETRLRFPFARIQSKAYQSRRARSNCHGTWTSVASTSSPSVRTPYVRVGAQRLSVGEPGLKYRRPSSIEQ